MSPDVFPACFVCSRNITLHRRKRLVPVNCKLCWGGRTRVSHGGGGKVKREENTVYLRAVSSLDSCPAWSWYLCLESACTLVGPLVASEAGGRSLILFWVPHPTCRGLELQDCNVGSLLRLCFRASLLFIIWRPRSKRKHSKKTSNCKAPQRRMVCSCSKNQIPCVPLESASSMAVLMMVSVVYALEDSEGEFRPELGE